MLWIERLVVENDQKKLFAVAPPVLSRAFQELSAGSLAKSFEFSIYIIYIYITYIYVHN